MKYADRLQRLEKSLPPDPIERQKDWEKCVAERAQIIQDTLTVMRYMTSIAPEWSGLYEPASPDTPTVEEFIAAEIRLNSSY